jgi:hypothetical protein
VQRKTGEVVRASNERDAVSVERALPAEGLSRKWRRCEHACFGMRMASISPGAPDCCSYFGGTASLAVVDDQCAKPVWAALDPEP